MQKAFQIYPYNTQQEKCYFHGLFTFLLRLNIYS